MFGINVIVYYLCNNNKGKALQPSTLTPTTWGRKNLGKGTLLKSETDTQVLQSSGVKQPDQTSTYIAVRIDV